MFCSTVRPALCLFVFLGVAGLAWAEDPTPKGEEPAPKAAAEPEKAAESPTKPAEPPAGPAASPAKPSEPAAKPSEPPPATVTVKPGPLKVSVELDGILEAQKSHEIVVKLDEWNSLIVETAVPHGQHVREGDVLLKLDTEKIDRAIADLRTDLQLSELSLQQSGDQLQVSEKLTPLDLESAEREARTAEEDQKTFTDTERPFMLKQIDFGLKMATDALEYQEEELRQLEKMYKADDITEETEEIVLRRARDAVDRAKFSVEMTQLNRELALRFMLPRMGDAVKESAERKKLDSEKSKATMPLGLQKQRIELDRQRVQRERSEDRLKKLMADREAMTIRSPADGIVYYGKCVRGKFTDSNALAESLRRYGTIQPNQVVMTVVQPRPMFLRATVPEDQLSRIRPGLKGVATPTGYPKLKLSATVDRVSDIPFSPGSFDAMLSISLERKSKGLLPGMTCKVKFTPYQKKDALSIPSKCVSADEWDDDKHFVYVLDEEGKPAKRPVTLGEKADKRVEILKGLAEGDKVLLEPPKDQK